MQQSREAQTDRECGLLNRTLDSSPGELDSIPSSATEMLGDLAGHWLPVSPSVNW